MQRCFAALVFVAIAVGCSFGDIELNNRRCPCIDGWICSSGDVCVPENQPDGAAVDASVMDGSVVDGGLRDATPEDGSFPARDAGPGAPRCSSPTVIGSGTYSGVLESGSGDGLDLACGRTGRVEHVYAVDLTSPSDLVINATPDHVYSIRTNCNDASSAIACSAFSQTFRGLDPGRYYLVFESDVSTPVEAYEFEISVTPGSTEPTANRCENADPVVPGTMTRGDTTNKTDNIVACGVFFRDTVYRLDVATPSDVRVQASYPGLSSLLAECPGTPISCSGGFATMYNVWRNQPAGTYYVVLQTESGNESGFDFVVDLRPPTELTAVEGHPSCAAPVIVPPGGGVFVGSNAGGPNNSPDTCAFGAESVGAEHHFQIEIATRSRLVLRTTAAGDPVLALFTAGCTGTPLACVDDAEDFSAYFSRGPYVDLMVDPGTYIVMLDTYESSASYTLDIDIEPTPLATP